MIKGILAFLKRKQSGPKPKDDAATDKPQQAKIAKSARFAGGATEKTQDLLISHDGGRVGFHGPVDR